MKHGPARSAGAVIVTYLIVVAACSPSASGGPRAGASASATAAVAVGPTGLPSATVGWQRSSDQPAFQGTGLTSVAWTGTRFLATPISGGDPAVLDSADGRTWHRQPGWRGFGPMVLAPGPRGVVAVGVGPDGTVAIWHSADGLTWSAAPHQDALKGQDGALEQGNAVIASEAGWLVVGFEGRSCAGCLVRAVVLTSTDGIRWTRLPDQPALRYADMTAIARGPSGYVAVGTIEVDPKRGDAGLRAAAWTSPDGRAWTSIGAPPIFDVPAGWAGAGPTDVTLTGVAAQGDRLVIVGEVATRFGSDTVSVTPVEIAWWFDGHAWTPVKIGPWTGEPSVAAVPGGFIAMVGSGPSCASGMWTSANGNSWACFDDPVFDGFAVSGVAASPDVEVLVGSRGGSSDADPAVAAAWTLALR